jgi:hypothetical protein
MQTLINIELHVILLEFILHNIPFSIHLQMLRTGYFPCNCHNMSLLNKFSILAEHRYVTFNENKPPADILSYSILQTEFVNTRNKRVF